MDTIIHSHPETKDQCMRYTRLAVPFVLTVLTIESSSKKKKAGSTCDINFRAYAKDCGKDCGKHRHFFVTANRYD